MSILDAARREAQRHPGARVSKVGVCIGEWAGVDPEALRFCFDSLGTDIEAAPALDIEFRPRQNRCGDCGVTFVVKDYEIECPHCGQAGTQAVSGNELDLAYVELEQP